MSQTGIFILETKGPEYRVAFADSKIEDIFGEFDKVLGVWKGDAKAIKEYFGDSPPHTSKDLALGAAMMLSSPAGIVESDEYEFGICNIIDFVDKPFKELVKC